MRLYSDITEPGINLHFVRSWKFGSQITVSGELADQFPSPASSDHFPSPHANTEKKNISLDKYSLCTMLPHNVTSSGKQIQRISMRRTRVSQHTKILLWARSIPSCFYHPFILMLSIIHHPHAIIIHIMNRRILRPWFLCSLPNLLPLLD